MFRKRSLPNTLDLTEDFSFIIDSTLSLFFFFFFPLSFFFFFNPRADDLVSVKKGLNLWLFCPLLLFSLPKAYATLLSGG